MLALARNKLSAHATQIRSTGNSRLAVPPVKLTNRACRSTDDVTSTFRQRVKTYLQCPAHLIFF